MNRPALKAPARQAGELVEMLCPSVGLWRNAPAVGALVVPGAVMGQLEVLGVLHDLVSGSTGVVTEKVADGSARAAVEHGQVLLRLSRDTTVAVTELVEAAGLQTDGVMHFTSPTSGRFYSRPAPGTPPFVAVGDELDTGATVCLLEVMKTFNRIKFGGEGMPARACVTEIVPSDGDDLQAGQVILKLMAL